MHLCLADPCLNCLEHNCRGYWFDSPLNARAIPYSISFRTPSHHLVVPQYHLCMYLNICELQLGQSHAWQSNTQTVWSSGISLCVCGEVESTQCTAILVEIILSRPCYTNMGNPGNQVTTVTPITRQSQATTGDHPELLPTRAAHAVHECTGL